MRSVSTGVRRGGALLLVLAVLAVPAVFADDDPYEPPEARARPPIGATADPEPPGFFGSILDWWIGIFARVRPPIG